ncbi:MAG: tetratricopeptide repeat protein [Chloroflexota bacterium]
MQTKISVLCEKVLEAGWLVAIITVPVFFNLYSARIYEPDKLTFVRSVAVLMIAVWLIRLIEQAGAGEATSEGSTPKATWGALVRGTPLVLPTLLLAGVYLFATLLSISDRVSLWGSYQRLQGTYTTLSYMVIFAVMLQTLRSRAQIDRLVTVVILAGVPVSFYGILQHYGLDPLPWIGNVQARVASNMGNSIFVAAYLILVAPLTWARAFDAFAALLLEEEGSAADVIRGALYVFVAALQVITIYWTGSRGPQLGLMAGALFFLLVLGFVRRWRWLVWGTVGLGLIGVIFLVVLNIPNGPLESLKTNRYIGRLGQVFETESGTGKVRVLIWQGAIELILPHDPLEFPDGSTDSLNLVRPLVGYGPEAMWVAYNRFYPPDLAHVEARNASPDRSHNETFDALVITGLIGFVVYMVFFASVFYYGFKWLGLIRSQRERNLFAVLWVVGGIVGAVAAGLGRQEFVGVGLPLGIIAGVGVYLAIVTTFLRSQIEPPTNRWYQLLMIGLISALIAHFVEIHFGIAIAATRTYFWAYAALLVVVGYLMEQRDTAEKPVGVAPLSTESQRSRRKRRRQHPRSMAKPKGSFESRAPAWLSPTLVYALLVGYLLVVLTYDFVTNQARETAVGDIIWHSLTTKLVNGQMAPTFGVIGLFILVWWVGGGLAIAEMIKAGLFHQQRRDTWARAFLLFLPFPPLLSLIYAAWHVNTLRQPILRQGELNVLQQADLIALVLVVFYLMAFLMLLLIGLALYAGRNTAGPARLCRGPVSWVHLPILGGAALLIWLTNVNVIRADIIFKQGEVTDRSRLWSASVQVYQHAIDVAPNEDYYYLFVGRAYLEWARDSSLEPTQRLAILEECRKALEKARSLNPLNTDHSANLARLYHSWALYTTDPDEQLSRIQQSLEYYAQATRLSPHNAQLLNEWASVYMTVQRFDEALEKLERSLALDSQFDMTYFALGSLYYNTGQLELAAEMYEQGLAQGKIEDSAGRRQAQSLLGVIYAQLGRHDQAVQTILKVLEERPNDFDALKNLALVYRDTNQIQQAILFARRAAEAQPDYAPIHQLMGELYRAARDYANAELSYRQALALDPQDINLIWSLAMVYWDQGRYDEAIAQLEEALALTPGNVQIQQALGDLYVRAGDWPKAIQAYEAVLAVQPGQVAVRNALIQVYAETGQLEAAVAQTLEVLALVPDDFASYENLARLYQQMGRIDEALSAAEKALELAPENERQPVLDLIQELQQTRGS